VSKGGQPPRGLEQTHDRQEKRRVAAESGEESGAVSARSVVLDPNLASLLEAWPELTKHVEATILTLAAVARGSNRTRQYGDHASLTAQGNRERGRGDWTLAHSIFPLLWYYRLSVLLESLAGCDWLRWHTLADGFTAILRSSRPRPHGPVQTPTYALNAVTSCESRHSPAFGRRTARSKLEHQPQPDRRLSLSGVSRPLTRLPLKLTHAFPQCPLCPPGIVHNLRRAIETHGRPAAKLVFRPTAFSVGGERNPGGVHGVRE
jgi:hypothetical protein